MRQKDQPARAGDGVWTRPLPDSRSDEITASDLEAMCSTSTLSCFETGAPVHCELPPEPEGWGPGFNDAHGSLTPAEMDPDELRAWRFGRMVAGTRRLAWERRNR